MALTIVNTGVGAYLEGETWIKELIMGEPGAGKTRSASFWPKPIFANCERKTMSLLDRNVPSAQVGSLADMEELLRLLRMEGQKPIPQRRWQTFVIDTFDAFQRTLINERLVRERREKFINDDWNWMGTKINQFLEQVANLPMHVVVNLHVKDVTEGEGDERAIKTKAHLKGDVRDQIAAEFDLVGFMESFWSVEPVPGKAGERQKVLRRHVQWTQDERHPTLKDCSGQLGHFTEVDFTEDDFLRIWEPIIGRLDDLPESTAEQIEVPGGPVQRPAQFVGPLEGGPVASPEQATAAATPPAKKAAAKKAAPAKKTAQAAPKPPDPTPTSETSSASPPSSAAAPETTSSASSDGSANAASSETGASSAPPPNPSGGEPEPDQGTIPSPPDGPNEPASTATPVAVPDAAPAGDDVDQAAAQLAAEGVSGDVVSDESRADPSPTTTPETDASAAPALVCGQGEGDFIGCGKELPASGFERDRAELAYVRWRNRLCPDCFQKAKSNTLSRKSAA